MLLDFDGERVLTDPWFAEKRGYYRGEPLGFTPTTLPRLSAVLASHDHYDHYDLDGFSAYPDKTVPFVVKRGMAAKARQAGFAVVTELEPWEDANFGHLRITACPARHGVPEITYVIQAADATVFFGADTLRIPELDEVAERFPDVDLALLPVNGLQIRPAFNRPVVMSAEQAAELCAVLRPGRGPDPLRVHRRTSPRPAVPQIQRNTRTLPTSRPATRTRNDCANPRPRSTPRS